MTEPAAAEPREGLPHAETLLWPPAESPRKAAGGRLRWLLLLAGCRVPAARLQTGPAPKPNRQATALFVAATNLKENLALGWSIDVQDIASTKHVG